MCCIRWTPALFLNSGIARVCRCILPSGTIVNPVFPAAVGMRTLSGQPVARTWCFGAFAAGGARPADAGSPGSGGLDPEREHHRQQARAAGSWPPINPMTGGAGGRAAEDRRAWTGPAAIPGFLKNTPVEVNEVEAGIKGHALWPRHSDSAGPGLHRGGLGTEMIFQTFSPSIPRSPRATATAPRFTGWGIAGWARGRGVEGSS